MRRDEAGFALAEVLVAVAILGIAVATIVGGMGSLAFGSDRHRKAATADTVVRDYIEALGLAVSQLPTGAWCVASSPGYPVTSYTPPAGYTVAQTSFGGCPALNATTPQFQTVTVVASSVDGRASARVITTVRPS